MTAVSFHLGKKLKLNIKDKEVFSSLIREEEVDYMKRCPKEQHKVVEAAVMLEHILEQVNEAIGAVVIKRFEDKVDEIVHYLLNRETRADDCGFANEVAAKVPSALVTCSFTDIERLISMCKKEIGSQAQFIKVALDSTVNSIIDQVKKEKEKTHFIVVLEQVESFSGDFLSRLICLLSSLSLPVSLMACLSTHPSVFASLCSTRALDLLIPSLFELDSPVRVCGEILENLQNVDCGLYFSGEFFKKIRSQFQFADFSTQEVKKAVRFAIAQHFVEKPLWMFKDRSDFNKSLLSYWLLFYVFMEQLECVKESPSKIENWNLHEEIQKDEKVFWESEIVSKWRQSFASNVMSIDDLINRAEIIADKIDGLNGSDTQLRAATLRTRVVRLRDASNRAFEAKIEGTDVTKTVKKEEWCSLSVSQHGTPSREKPRMSVVDLRRRNVDMMKAKREDPVTLARFQLVTEIEHVFKQFLTSWTKFKDHEWFLIGDNGPIFRSLDSPNIFIEETLLCDKTTDSCPVAVAMKAILCGDSWKSIRLGECISEYASGAEPTEGHSTSTVCQAALGQLEMMGVLKSGPDRKYPTVIMLYHPSSYMPS